MEELEESTRKRMFELGIKEGKYEERINIIKKINKRFPEDSTPLDVSIIIEMVKEEINKK